MICSANVPVDRYPDLTWQCTQPKGHDGDHLATVPNGDVKARWPQ